MLTLCSLFRLLSTVVSWITGATTVGSTLSYAGNSAFAKDIIAVNLKKKTTTTTTTMMESKDTDEKKK